MSVSVYVRNAERKRVAEVDDFQQLQVRKGWRGTGSWSLDLEATTEGAELLNNDEAGIIVERDDELLFTGPVGLLNRSYKQGANRLIVTGPDDSAWVSRRRCDPCLPTLSSSGVSYPDRANDVQVGTAELVMKHYVDFNLGLSALESRRLTNFVVAPSQGRGAAVAASARFDMLNTILDTVATAGGDLGYSITHGVEGYDPTTLVFDVRESRQMQKLVIFSLEFGNISEFDYENSIPGENSVLVAGQGQGINRNFVAGSDNKSVTTWGLIEGPLVDRRDTNEHTLLVTSLNDTLSKTQASNSVAITASSTDSMAYSSDWQLGDYVTVMLDNQPVVDVIREIDFLWDKDKPEVIRPIIGGPGTNRPKVPKLFATQRNLMRRVSQLEGRL